MNLRRCATGAGALAALMAGIVLPGAAPAGAQPTLDDKSVRVVVADMNPTTAVYSDKPRPLTISLAFTNTTDQQLYQVHVDVTRDQPYSRQSQLEQLMAHPEPSPDTSVLTQLPTFDLPQLSPHQTIQYTYKTRTSPANDGKSVCVCFESGGGVYPINFTVTAADDPQGGTTEVGFGQTYLPAFKDAPKPVQVSWVWPLIDRPHRLIDGTFIDDDLARSVSPGGRLYRALSVVEGVKGAVRLTLMIDPELIDELAAMTQPYTVEKNGKKVPGTGTGAARTWLAQLRGVVTTDQVSLTPYADPDVDALSGAGLSWANGFGPDEQQQLQGALGEPPQYDVAWPADGMVSADALRQMLRNAGVTVAVLSDRALAGVSHNTPRPSALAPLPAQFGMPGTVAAVTDTAIQNWSDRTLTPTAAGAATLPQLTSELAVRAVEQSDQSHYVVITAPRYVNVNPSVARRALLATAQAPWSTSLTLNTAAQDKNIPRVDHGQLVQPSNEQQIPEAAISTAQSVTSFLRSFTTALTNAASVSAVSELPTAIQRVESSAWRKDPGGGGDFAARLQRQVSALGEGVRIQRPSSGAYTLASNDAPLPITVINTLPVEVRVRVRVTTANGVSGFRSDDQRILTLAAATGNNPSHNTLKIQAHVQRAGTFQVDAVLLAPDGTPLGSPVPLSIHCTALGAVGVIITAVAGGVLLLALALRVFRRMRAGRRPAPEPARPDGPVAPVTETDAPAPDPTAEQGAVAPSPGAPPRTVTP